MDFERKYGTKFWTLIDEITERAELSKELAGYETVLENLKKHEEKERENEELLKQGIAVKSTEKESCFRKLANEACCLAEMCAMDIAVNGVAAKRGSIELKSDAIMLLSATHRAILSELLQSADNVYVDAVDGEVRMKFSYNLFTVEYDQ